MEKDADVPKEPTSDETPPPFEPDPDIVTFRERGGKLDPKEVWRATAKSGDVGAASSPGSTSNS
jgi:hypothetical protein